MKQFVGHMESGHESLSASLKQADTQNIRSRSECGLADLKVKQQSAADHQPKVAILLCTYQGQRYLATQLASFEAQTYSNWKVWASDDGSQDDTRSILEQYQQKWSADRLSIHCGPAAGFATNFLSLTCNPDVDADYYAFSDQDDVWELGKLARAVTWLQSVPPDVPALHCSRTRLVDAHDTEIGLSPLFARPPSFANALMQNIAGGNTMMFNHAARELLKEAGPHLSVATHDWWVYMVVTGCGGRVFYDTEPSLRYRQHDDNLVGMNSTWMSRLRRLRMLWKGSFRQWNDAHVAALLKLQHKLTPQNLETLNRFVRARQMSLIPRLIHIKRSGVYRQTLMSNLGLIAAAIFRKL
jgi:glycosyltransferase involved in cell wall biosynthesis